MMGRMKRKVDNCTIFIEELNHNVSSSLTRPGTELRCCLLRKGQLTTSCSVECRGSTVNTYAHCITQGIYGTCCFLLLPLRSSFHRILSLSRRRCWHQMAGITPSESESRYQATAMFEAFDFGLISESDRRQTKFP